MAKIEHLHEIQGNVQEINFFPSELFVIFRTKNVYEYIKYMDKCQEVFHDDKKKVSLCMLEKYCPHEVGRFFDCKEKEMRSICWSEQNQLEYCIKKPINQLMNILGKHKLY